MLTYCNKKLLLSSCALLALSFPSWAFAQAAGGSETAVQTAPASSGEESIEDIVVTAQKRQESVNKVGMSITAATGEQLTKLGVTDVSQLTKIVPGFRFNVTAFGSPVYTIRGVGYQESSLAAGPAVSVYVDEVPLPYSTQTIGAALDLARVEVLKGPQGTLFGGNSTGGAINYIAAKPTDEFAAGATASYGRFNTADLSGYVSGPISDTLSARVALRSLQSDDWQKSITRVDTIGERNQLLGRVLLDWKPVDGLRVSLNVNGWRDRSESQAPQLVAKLAAVNDPAALSPAFVAAPLAPAEARAADWDPEKSYRNNNRFWQVAGKIEYDLSSDITLTSITSYQKFKRYQPLDVDGSAVEAFFILNTGYIESFFQELRLAGQIGDVGHWMIGGNYQKDDIFDNTRIGLSQSSQRTVALSSRNQNLQKVDTKAVFANLDYEVVPAVKLNGGIRYTKADRSFSGCTRDSGDGTFAAFINNFAGTSILPGECISFRADGTTGFIDSELDEDNISWRAGVDFEPAPGTLLYANVSKGYKAGSFPNLTVFLAPQVRPVTQESLLAYEAGFKVALLDRTLQLNGAAFYYDYTNKQVRGLIDIPPIRTLETLLNIPKSRVQGFELSAVWRPVPGLTISPAVSYTDSKVTKSFVNLSGDGTLTDFKGQAFPNTPKWSGSTDAEFRWDLSDRLQAFVGTTISYQSKTNGFFRPAPQFEIDGYALLDLRAGVEGADGRWNASIWGRNVTDKYYWTSAVRGSDGVVRYAGMPATYGVTLGFRY